MKSFFNKHLPDGLLQHFSRSIGNAIKKSNISEQLNNPNTSMKYYWYLIKNVTKWGKCSLRFSNL